MPAAPRIVTGNVKTLAGLARAGIEVTFVRTGAGDVFGQNDEVVVNEPIKATSGEGGALSVTLYPGSYSILCSGANGPKRATMALTEDGSTDLTDLIGQAAPLLTSAAELARDKAREWATNPEDDPVEPDEFSALHWSAKAQSLGAVEVEKARVWAENPEDDEVAAGQFSALHHAAKSAASAGEAADSAAAAAVSETNAAASEAAAELAAADTAASVVSYGAIRDQIEADRAEIAVNKDLAYGYQQSAAAAVAYQNLSAVALSKAETAVDVFVYDTSKDSDGGAWRKRCQHTSWYNETLNTATRGARREFPAVAVIVATSVSVIIYDADDPTLPMWMVFTGGFTTIHGQGRDCVFMLNGKLAAGGNSANGTSYDLHEIDFIADRTLRRADTFGGWYKGNIAQRGDGSDWDGNLPATSRIPSRLVNDVAMTVLPDAPVDPATGLPVPTIAVATASGVSVIRQDGSVASPASMPSIGSVFFEGTDIWAIATASYFGAQRVNGPLYDTASANNRLYTSAQGNTAAPKPLSSTYLEGGVGMKGTEFALRDNVHGLIKALWGKTLPDAAFQWNSSMVAQITSLYNTGWMHGSIRGAFLSSKDTTSLVGSSNRVSNGSFDADTTGWYLGFGTSGASTFLASGGVATLTAGAGDSSPRFVTAISGLTVGALYALGITNAGGSGAGDRTLIWTSASNGIGGLTFFNPASGTRFVVATAETMYIAININNPATGSTFIVDNISLLSADFDRSFNGFGFIVNGTITRAPVAAGAELVGYSGFSLANYLEQPYNSALDFGTGDFCVMGWVNVTGTGSILERMSNPGDGDTGIFLSMITSTILRLRLYDGGLFTDFERTVASGLNFFCCGRRSGVGFMSVNGQPEISSANTYNISGATPVTRIGERAYFLTFPLSGSLALLRIGATAPTPEQIRRIYEDERPLFQPGAACTLYGASDFVTALAYDPDTDLLHVGTSAGRSVFKGLRRVSNTAVAVGAAISAMNGLVVEE